MDMDWNCDNHMTSKDLHLNLNETCCMLSIEKETN